MGTYPWGPHGPQSGPNQVTPNPTPAYVPPPPSPTPSWQPAAPSYGGGGGTTAGSGAAPYTGTGTYTPGKKSYVFALILTFLFGPLGLFYASKKGALLLLLLLVGGPVLLNTHGASPVALINALGILSNTMVMAQMWSIVATLSIVWSVLGVASYNRSIKKRD